MKSRILKACFIIIILFTIITLVNNIILYKNHIKKVNDNILGAINIIKEKCPNIEDEEIVNILNKKKNSKYDLEKFGINSDDIYMLQNTEVIYKSLIISNITIVFVLGLTFLILLLIYVKNRTNKINEITKYIKEINKKNYSLKLDENVEDELSILQNELYKITILLKEQSENAIADKKNVKDSMSDVSHQLKTPLTSVMIGLDNIIDNPNMNENTRKEFLNDCKNQIENINFLIISILKLSRFDANVIKFTKEEINVKKILSEILKNLENISNSKNIKIEFSGNEEIFFIGDYKWEIEALTNIIKNSIEHLNENGIINIKYRKLSIYIEIIIEDNGKGIHPKDLKHIFERFYKGKNSSKESIGIGLSLSKRIIENDNGYIIVNSKLNEGTKFTIRYMKKGQ